jgi:hypothetical protein
MLSLCVGLGASAQATDLIISEYIEGSSNNKYIEIYNGTGARDQSGELPGSCLYANGSATISPRQDAPAMTGMLAAGATAIVYKNSGAPLGIRKRSNCQFSRKVITAMTPLSLDKIAPAGFVDIVREHRLRSRVLLGPPVQNHYRG